MATFAAGCVVEDAVADVRRSAHRRSPFAPPMRTSVRAGAARHQSSSPPPPLSTFAPVEHDDVVVARPPVTFSTVESMSSASAPSPSSATPSEVDVEVARPGRVAGGVGGPRTADQAVVAVGCGAGAATDGVVAAVAVDRVGGRAAAQRVSARLPPVRFSTSVATLSPSVSSAIPSIEAVIRRRGRSS